MTLSIIIVSYNTRPYTIACIESIYRTCTLLAPEIIVVDNNSRDGTPDEIRDRFPSVRLMAAGSNLGFSVANNRAIEIAAGDLVALLNPDTLVQPDCFQSLIKILEQNPKIAAVGPLQLKPDLTVWQYETWSITPLTYLLQPLLLATVSANRSKYVSWLCGACILIRREVLNAVGPLDVEMFGEDIDLCHRVRRLGYHVYHCAEAKIVHYWGTSAATPESIARRILTGRRSKVYYAVKHSGVLTGFAFCLSISAESVSRVIWLSCIQMLGRGSTLSQRRRSAFAALAWESLTARPLFWACGQIKQRFGRSPGLFRGLEA